MNFIEISPLNNIKLCDEFIELFHQFKSHHSRGQVMKNDTKGGVEDKNVKDSTDLSINWWKSQSQPTVKAYQEELEIKFLNYRNKYEMCQQLRVGLTDIFNIQYYKPNGGYKAWHFERHHNEQKRIFAFMTYLNDVPDGSTEFFYQNMTIKAKKGDTVIWPAEWTHTHKSQISKVNDKYIATGWFGLISDKEHGSS